VGLEQTALEDPQVQEFWQQQIARLTPTTLPTDPELPPADAPGTLATEERQVDGALALSLEQLARSMGVPLKTLLLAAHLRTLALATGQERITTGLVTNGRPEAEDGERLLGLFLNTLPVSATLGGSWRELIDNTAAAERELLPRRRFPLARIQQMAGGQGLFETAFNYKPFSYLRPTRTTRLPPRR
jgi:non-ribosomal peptide synthetase component F